MSKKITIEDVKNFIENASHSDIDKILGVIKDKKLHISDNVIGRSIPNPPEPPLCRIIREGSRHFCTNCGSTASRNGFLGIFGEMLCHNPKCPNSKSKKNYR